METFKKCSLKEFWRPSCTTITCFCNDYKRIIGYVKLSLYFTHVIFHFQNVVGEIYAGCILKRVSHVICIISFWFCDILLRNLKMFKGSSIMIYASSFSSLLLWPLFKNTHILLEREREQIIFLTTIPP